MREESGDRGEAMEMETWGITAPSMRRAGDPDEWSSEHSPLSVRAYNSGLVRKAKKQKRWGKYTSPTPQMRSAMNGHEGRKNCFEQTNAFLNVQTGDVLRGEEGTESPRRRRLLAIGDKQKGDASLERDGKGQRNVG